MGIQFSKMRASRASTASTTSAATNVSSAASVASSMATAHSGLAEARAAGNKHFERGAKLKEQIRREAREEKARERRALKEKAFKESPQALEGIVPEPDSAGSLARKRSAHLGGSGMAGSQPDVDVAHPCCPDYSMQLV